MKKIFAILMMVLAFSTTADAQGKWTIKAGVGLASVDEIGHGRYKMDTDNTFSWKIGAGYELQVNNLIGIEPGAFLTSKGCELDDEAWNPLYLDIPVMCNFHVTDHLVIGVGPTVGVAVAKDDADEMKTADFSVRSGLKYVFDNGLNLGFDMSYGLTDTFKEIGGKHFGLCAIVGFSF